MKCELEGRWMHRMRITSKIPKIPIHAKVLLVRVGPSSNFQFHIKTVLKRSAPQKKKKEMHDITSPRNGQFVEASILQYLGLRRNIPMMSTR